MVSMHKIAGRLAFAFFIIHMGITINKMPYHGHRFDDPFNFFGVNMWAGMVAFIATVGLICTSVPYIRRYRALPQPLFLLASSSAFMLSRTSVMP